MFWIRRTGVSGLLRLCQKVKEGSGSAQGMQAGGVWERIGEGGNVEKRGDQGSITVFLSLICILFLSLICAVTESARIQGAKAQTANITGLGNFSVLGEFERPLLDGYEIFALDGAYGTGYFRPWRTEEQLETYLRINANPKEGVFSVWCFDPWKLELTDSRILQYALLTDGRGEPFYQQAVAFMKANAAFLAADALKSYAEESQAVARWQEEYEQRKRDNEHALSDLEGEKKQRLEQLESEAAQADSETAPAVVPEQSNPLKEIDKIRKKGIFEVMTGGKAISEKKLQTGQLPSKHRPSGGTLKLRREYGGAVDDALFREYLMLYFPDYLDEKQEGRLDYQLEYLLGGKVSDRLNLKYVIQRLLLIREGMNYLYCLENPQMQQSTGKLAAALTGFLGMPALTAATQHALLLAWAFGESLIDVRTLLDGGRIPLFKDAASWRLTLENLGRLTELLQQGGSGQEEGLEYGAYLRILLNLGSLSDQKMRALDMIQSNLQQKEGTEKFRAENCIVAIRTETKWSCRPMFFRLAGAVMGIRGKKLTFRQEGAMSYCN